jgi:chaperonin GroEL (HSP60 family)
MIAKEIEVRDGLEYVCGQVMKGVTSQPSSAGGGGAVITTVLAQTMLRKGVKKPAGANPMGLKQEIEQAMEQAVRELKMLGKPAKGETISQAGRVKTTPYPLEQRITYAQKKRIQFFDPRSAMIPTRLIATEPASFHQVQSGVLENLLISVPAIKAMAK